ncbi:MAG TPA: Zn-ribbon domain-containing OB-fold protein [Candidatus Bathyarchaeia archaeon]|nr:Zn-ribbon domain-containing OB-fold protein [Candidatus Bathyarchaeia archaeon]
MPLLEKLDQLSKARHWTDSIPLEFHYTAGVAGEAFRMELKENGRFLSSKCPKCKTSYVPARMFCPACFIELTDNKPIEKLGYVYSFTTVKRDRAGETLDEPVTLALVKFDGIEGGIIHRLENGTMEKVGFGTRVRPVLKPAGERTGALSDVLVFRIEQSV